MKKIPLFFAVILVLALFAGCGKQETPNAVETTLSTESSGTGAISSAAEVAFVSIGNPMRAYIPDSEESWHRARNVWDLQVYNGKLYIGSGDYSSNSGSKLLGGSHVLAYDLTTGIWLQEYTAGTEQIDRFIPAWGNLYIPSCDSTKSGSSVFSCLDGTWQEEGFLPTAVHMFDLLCREDGKTAFAGVGYSYGDDPGVYISTDRMKGFSCVFFRKDGRIFKGDALAMGSASKYDQFSRTYNLLEYNGEVYATLCFTTNANVSDEDKRLYNACNGLYRYNAAENVFDFVCNCPELLSRNFATHSSDVIFQGRVVAACGRMAASTTQDLTKWEYIEGFTGPVTDLAVIGDALYFTTYFADAEGNYTNRLYRTCDLQTFEELHAFDHTCSVGSFAYTDGAFYLGTECTLKGPDAGEIFQLTLSNPNCTHPYPAEDGSCPDCGYSK